MTTFVRPHVLEEELHAYCDGELSPSQRSEIAEHLLGCLICRAQRAEVEALRVRVSTMLRVAAPRRQGIPALPKPARARGLRRAPRIMVAAAVAVIGVGVMFSLQRADHQGGSATLATSLGASDLFRFGHSSRDQAAIRDRELTMAGRLLARPQIQAAPAATTFAPPVAIGKAIEVDPVVASEWSVASIDEALRVADGRLAHLPGVPVKLVRIHPSVAGGRPTFLIRQELADGKAVWVLEGLEHDIAPVDQLVQASGIAMSIATRTRPDYVGTGTETAITTRMVRVVGYLPADSLNTLVQKLVMR